MASRRQSPASRRTLAIKRADGEPLTRADIQYDFLYAVFHDNHCVFTDPYSPGGDAPKICFRDLYIKSLLNSSKATKALKEKMNVSPTFSEDFAMLALLVNVGRINTTMSFFPEMKTAIRTYHPIPSLQRTDGNLLDAPRIKHILKTSLLEDEAQGPPNTPTDILARIKDGHVPSTSIPNLVFVLVSHSSLIGQKHLSDELDFNDLFLRREISSLTRARTFLWLVFNYLEASSVADDDDYDDEGAPNPFSDPRRGVPSLIPLTSDEVASENIDSVQEKTLAEKLTAQRSQAVKSHGQSAKEARGDSKMTDNVLGGFDNRTIEEPKSKTKKVSARAMNKNKRILSVASKEKGRISDAAHAERVGRKAGHGINRSGSTELTDDDYESLVTDIHSRYFDKQHQFNSSPTHSLKYKRGHRYAPYESASIMKNVYKPHSLHNSQRAPASLLEQAWHVVTTRDPLIDSDDELGDEYDRWDYSMLITLSLRF
ncbi:hypothetical protein BDQ12DRAFT_600597 [Crucibulum laeve]|uniref:Ino eighty subunit 1 n=1 Tax=Crucibulum laeve TaxID=68775 RepID=A0A5C3M689_9AGAR|nr:hypothetical protein BDQ12DRAFT_600597 [Crucibulum laeve]